MYVSSFRTTSTTADVDIHFDRRLSSILATPVQFLVCRYLLRKGYSNLTSDKCSDLEHYRCNRVWVPWYNKGTRRTKSLWEAIGVPEILHFYGSESDLFLQDEKGHVSNFCYVCGSFWQDF